MYQKTCNKREWSSASITILYFTDAMAMHGSLEFRLVFGDNKVIFALLDNNIFWNTFM